MTKLQTLCLASRFAGGLGGNTIGSLKSVVYIGS